MKECQAPNCNRNSNTHPNRVGHHSNSGLVLCEKHKNQFNRHGEFLEQTRFEPNKIVVHNYYAEVFCNNRDGEISNSFIIDIEDVVLISKYKWFIRTDNRVVANVTANENKNNTHIRVHNLIMGFEDFTLFDLVDHIDRNPRNNKKDNLRRTDAQTNIINRKKQSNNTSGVTGVCVSSSGKYIAQLKYNRKMIRFGTYILIEDAILARANAEAKYFGVRSINYDEPSNRIKICYNNKCIESTIEIKQ